MWKGWALKHLLKFIFVIFLIILYCSYCPYLLLFSLFLFNLSLLTSVGSPATVVSFRPDANVDPVDTCSHVAASTPLVLSEKISCRNDFSAAIFALN